MKTPMSAREIYRRYRAQGMGVAAAVSSVRRHDAFLKQLKEDNRAHRKRSQAARKGWRTRKARRAEDISL